MNNNDSNANGKWITEQNFRPDNKFLIVNYYRMHVKNVLVSKSVLCKNTSERLMIDKLAHGLFIVKQ